MRVKKKSPEILYMYIFLFILINEAIGNKVPELGIQQAYILLNGSKQKVYRRNIAGRQKCMGRQICK